VRISAFIWDENNSEKCLKHGLSLAQIEDFLLTQPTLIDDESHSDKEPRYIAFGYYNDRFLFVVFTLRVNDKKLKFRVISARYARAKEIKRLENYEKAKNTNQKKKSRR
jgi:uncharacterized DUF497 family protein